MYLVHAELRTPHPGAALPPDTAGLLLAAALPEERIEHIAVHRPTEAEPVLGVYLIADRLTEAETVVTELCRRAVSSGPLHGWSMGRVGVPLVTPFYERLLSASGPAGRISPGPFPSI